MEIFICSAPRLATIAATVAESVPPERYTPKAY